MANEPTNIVLPGDITEQELRQLQEYCANTLLPDPRFRLLERYIQAQIASEMEALIDPSFPTESRDHKSGYVYGMKETKQLPQTLADNYNNPGTDDDTGRPVVQGRSRE